MMKGIEEQGCQVGVMSTLKSSGSFHMAGAFGNFNVPSPAGRLGSAKDAPSVFPSVLRAWQQEG